ncbi:hypothetical protein [Vibrio sp. SCSIO 43140]|nr:hypothetical protein [Vibrio sp. SCSIO 43140]
MIDLLWSIGRSIIYLLLGRLFTGVAIGFVAARWLELRNRYAW